MFLRTLRRHHEFAQAADRGGHRPAGRRFQRGGRGHGLGPSADAVEERHADHGLSGRFAFQHPAGQDGAGRMHRRTGNLLAIPGHFELQFAFHDHTLSISQSSMDNKKHAGLTS